MLSYHGRRLIAQAPRTMSKSIFKLNCNIHWIFDWDGTLTKTDTLDTLVTIAREVKPDSNVLEEWKRVSKAYLTDYEAALKNYNRRLPTTVSEERALLLRLRDVEQQSINRIFQSNTPIFKGLTSRDIHTGAVKAIESGQVQLRDGCHDLCQHIRTRQARSRPSLDRVNVLSVNWSQTFIAECLNAARIALKAETHVFLRPMEEDGLAEAAPFSIMVYANELKGIDDFDRGSSGTIDTTGLSISEKKLILSSADKLRYLQHLSKLNPQPTIYMGDSWTDFECLLAADLGICIRDEPPSSSQAKLADCLQRLGIACPHISEWDKTDEWGVVWARDFVEVRDWLRKLESSS
jgi:phosphoserine phosphatase